MRKCLLFLLILCSKAAFSQVNDSFSDGDFTFNPKWSGDTAAFVINADKQLQTLPSPSSQTVSLSTGNSLAENVKWEFNVQLNFDPSAQNQVRIYLISDSRVLTGNLNGYFIQIGESGSTDSYDLYLQSGNTITKIIDGPPESRSNPNVLKAKIAVTRDGSGNWELRLAEDDASDFTSEGTASDNTFTGTAFFGVSCKYTTTRSDKFIFDDFRVKSTLPADTVPPELSAVNVLDSLTLEAVFNEAVDPVSATDPGSYSLNNHYGNPAEIDSLNAVTYRLKFNAAFNTDTYTMTVNGVKDLNNNMIGSQNTFAFTYTKPFAAQKNDIVINEVFADPTPQIDLPDVEFVELFNTTNQTIFLDGWEYGDAATLIKLPADSIRSREYLILCAKSDTSEYKSFGRVIGLSPWPILNNPGDSLKLMSPQGITIDSVSYSDNWYKDPQKAAGGWTLERINAECSCPGFYNWGASRDASGGTPGRINSISSPVFGAQLEIDTVFMTSDTTLSVVFNSIPDTASNKATFYEVDKGIGTALSAVFSSDYSRVNLKFATSFKEGNTYYLMINGMQSCSGIKISAPGNAASFTVPGIPEKVYPVVINEIFADPAPEIGLPGVEFVELYNPSGEDVLLQGLSYEDASGTKYVFNSGEIGSGDYLIICPLKDTLNYKPFGKVLGIDPWPVLNNDKDILILRNNKGREIHRVTYDLNWYKDKEKQQGGYSLELIDPGATCSGIQNWAASTDPSGGTPGRKNSVFKTNTSTDPLILSNAVVTDSLTLTLSFNRYIDSLSASDPVNYSVNNGLGHPDSALPLGPEFRQVKLTFFNGISRGKTYKITVDNITDCAGSIIASSTNTDDFVYADKISKGDVLINEVLFNPRPEGVDFIEIYNYSDKELDLQELSIAATKDEDSLVNVVPLSDRQYLFEPGKYIVLTTDPDNIKQEYQADDPDAFLKMASMPAYNDKAGGIVLLSGDRRIDQFDYSEKMHFPLIKDPEGVSLERSSFKRPANEPGNFRSAAASAGYATPGFKNSQYQAETEGQEEVMLSSETFSPDDDGFEDYLDINYHFREAGKVANILVYNDHGMLIRRLIKNSTLSTEGTFTWDGLNESGEKALVGIYLVYFEVFDLGGSVKKYRRKCVLAAKLN